MRGWPALLLLGLAACSAWPRPPHPKPVNCFFGDERDLDSVRRVMALPFDLAPGVEADSFTVRQTFLQELTKIGRFELVPLPAGGEVDRDIYKTLFRGRLSTEAIVELGKRYQLDGVLMVTITSYRPYKPPHMGLRTQLLSIHSASTVWAADATYDSNDAATIEDLQHYAGSFAAEEETMHGWQINLISPTKFASFVSHRVVGTWRDATK